MRFTLVTASLAGGGAERVLSQMAKWWSVDGNDVSVILLGKAEEADYVTSQDLPVLELNLGESSTSFSGVVRNWRRIRRLRKAIRAQKPEVLVSFLTETNIRSICASIGLSVVTVVSERISPGDYDLPRAWRTMRRCTYPVANAVVVQTERGAAWLRRHVPGANVHVIRNPVSIERQRVPDEPAQRAISATNGHPLVLAVGRLNRQKGFDLLLSAFAAAIKDRCNWHLTILGDGPERGALLRQAEELGIRKRVCLPGYSSTPFVIMDRADLFVLSSRFEGMPTALLEAMACGLPAVSFDCPTGPREVIKHGVNGILVPPSDVRALEEALVRLIVDQALRRRLGREAVRIRESHSIGSVMNEWNELIARTTRGNRTLETL